VNEPVQQASRVAADAGAVPPGIAAFLGAPTPEAWTAAAAAALDLLLVDHAHCEHKAAASALAMIRRYPEHEALVHRLSRLAREELRHFEQVQAVLAERGIGFRQLAPSGYARGLHAAVRGEEPGRLVDSLLVAALIEARSCERFALLAPRLPEPLGRFYAGLLASEARHFEQYLALARGHADEHEVESRLRHLTAVEARLATSPDSVLRFHSGPPPARAGA
jgi:tRNA-(ms[2]io[6]A)-hydroxylase